LLLFILVKWLFIFCEEDIYMGTAIVIGITTVCVAGAVGEKILMSIGKPDDAQMLSLSVKCGIIVTALAVFAKVVSALSSLG
jgi:hypothetical protein